MQQPSDRRYAVREHLRDAVVTVVEAFTEFLTLPTLMIVLAVLAALGAYELDRIRPALLEPLRAFLQPRFFPNGKSTSDLLSAIATGIISVTSITVTLLLLVLQQSASSMTTQVFDQFLRRRSNQFFFGFFVGLALFALIAQAASTEDFVPVYSGALVFLGTAIALYMLVLLLYTIINQTRPTEIMAAIHDHILAARERELRVVRATRADLRDGAGKRSVHAKLHGFVTGIDVDRLGRALRVHDESSILLRVSIGTYVSFNDLLASIRAPTEAAGDVLERHLHAAIRIERKRDVARDAVYGVEELQTIGWTSISSAKSNPASGLMAVRAMRDLLARWACDGPVERDPDATALVYVDPTIGRVFDAFETFAVASSESKQPQAFAEVAEAMAAVFPLLPEAWRPRATVTVRRILGCTGPHLATTQVDHALRQLRDALDRADQDDTARMVEHSRRGIGRMLDEALS
jgi:uncharacterized membrane protein